MLHAEAKILADEMTLSEIHNTHKITARVPKAEIPPPKVKPCRIVRDGYSEKKLSRIRNRDRKFDKLRDFIMHISSSENFLHLEQYKSIWVGDRSADCCGSVSWECVPSSVDPGHNFVRNEPLGHNDYIERIMRESSQMTAVVGEDMASAPPEALRESLASQTSVASSAATDGNIPYEVTDEVRGRSSALSGAQRMTTRAIRKRCQVESFVEVIRLITACGGGGEGGGVGKRLHIVDFGAGAGNLCLPLAYLFPEHDFSAVDMKSHSIAILLQRAEAARLQNVKGYVQRIEEFDQSFDIALALHACGEATDYALWQAERCRAAYIVCPCCIGNLSFKTAGDSIIEPDTAELPPPPPVHSVTPKAACLFPAVGTIRQGSSDVIPDIDTGSVFSTVQCSALPPAINHPRSHWLMQELGDDRIAAEALFNAMVKSGDISHGSAHEHGTFNKDNEGIARMCKCYLEVDRNMHMKEVGYHTVLLRLIRSELTGKGELLVGVPQEVVEKGLMRWPMWEIDA